MTDPIQPDYQIPTQGPQDPILQELLPEFLDSWTNDLTTTWAGIRDRADAQELYRFGHTIKGSFIQFGFRDLAAAGREIMEDANAGAWNDADARVRALLSVVNTMRNHLSSSPSS